MADIRNFFGGATKVKKKKATTVNEADNISPSSKCSQSSQSSTEIRETPKSPQSLDIVGPTSTRSLPSVDQLISTYETWKIKLPYNFEKLSKSKHYNWVKKYDADWKRMFPWVVELKVDSVVVGLLCTICRSNFNPTDSTSKAQMIRSKGRWVTVPFVKFGDFLDEARVHEFGTLSSLHRKVCPIELRQKVKDGIVPTPSTAHCKYVLDQSTLEKVEQSGKGIDNTLKKMSNFQVNRNEKGLLQLLSIMHRTLKRSDSPFSSLKDAVLFSVDILECKNLQTFLRTYKISNRMVSDLRNAIYDLVLLGVLVEMSEGLQDEEPIIFGGIIDLGSKTKKTKEFAGVAIRYVNLKRESPSVVTRVIGFKRTVRKDGLTLCNILKDTFSSFNQRMQELRQKLGHLFPVKLDVIPVLTMANMHSLGVDGACISPVKMVNRRVLEYNSRCITTHCASHRTNLVAGDPIKENERHEMVHSVSTKLHDLVNASPKFEDLFKACQVQTQEVLAFPRKQPVVLGD